MGGGWNPPEPESLEHQAGITRLRQLCESATHGSASGGKNTQLAADYEAIDGALKDPKKGASVIVSNCAAYVETYQLLRSAARRYRNVELETARVVEGCADLAAGLRGVLPDVAGALATNHSSCRSALELAASKVATLGTHLIGVVAIHEAVAHDIRSVMALAEGVVKDPATADAGFTAAPILGGAVASTLGLLLRGPVGILAAVALAGAGALGARSAAASEYPLIKDLFLKMHGALGGILAAIGVRTNALQELRLELVEASSQIGLMLEVVMDGSERSRELRKDALAACCVSLDQIAYRCMACNYRSSPFLALCD